MKFSGTVVSQQIELFRPGNRLAAGINLQFAVDVAVLSYGKLSEISFSYIICFSLTSYLRFFLISITKIRALSSISLARSAETVNISL